MLGSLPIGDAAGRASGLVAEEWLRRALAGLDGASVEDAGLVTIQGTRDCPGWPARRMRVCRPTLGHGYPERAVTLSLTQNDRGDWVLRR